MMINRYLRKEPASDGTKNRFDVVAYRDSDCRERVAIIPWHYSSSKPDKRWRYITLNCFRYRIVWIDGVAA